MASTAHILLSLWIDGKAEPSKRSDKEWKSFSIKKRFARLYVSALGSALYFFRRHNAYCEPGIYSLFSICEYVIVLSNMGFHYMARYDFEKKVLQI